LLGTSSFRPPFSPTNQTQGSFAIDGNIVRFFHPAIQERFNITMLADTHLFKDDDRGVPFQQYSGRVAKAYNQTTQSFHHPMQRADTSM